MSRMIRVVVLALAVVAMVGGMSLTGHEVAAANANAQLVYSQTDGCSYLWDGYAYTAVFCPRTDGWVNMFQMQSGQWVFVAVYLWEGFGDYTMVTADGIRVSHYADGYEFYTYPDGSTGSNMTDAQLQVSNIIMAANNRGLAIVAAPDCTYSYNGCY